MAEQQSPAVPENLKLNVLVRSPGGRPLADAKVVVQEPNLGEKTTGANGLAVFEVANNLFRDPPSDPGPDLLLVTIAVSKRHHGPPVKPGEPFDNTAAIIRGTLARGRQGLATDDAEVDKQNQIHVLLVDGGTLAEEFPSIPTRRLTADQVQSELLFHHSRGNVVLASANEFEIEHDPSIADDARCEAGKCKIKKPSADQAVSMEKPLFSGVTIHALRDPIQRANKKPGEQDGDQKARDTFSWGKTSVRRIDQRHAVGLARIGRRVAELGCTILYTQGVSGDTTRKDSHGWGRAIDIGGFSRTEPAEQKAVQVRAGDDFIVVLHWGTVPMFDPATTSGNDKTQWKRFTGRIDDGRNYKDAGSGTLRYRLDPAPFSSSTVMGPHFAEAGTLFKDVYDFVVAEYTDVDSKLPADDLENDPSNPGQKRVRALTPIDAADSHFILHPDMGQPNSRAKDASGNPAVDAAGNPKFNKDGRQAHNNHYHIQLGPKHATSPPTVRPK